MAVSLPPPLAPQQGNVEELRARSSGATVLSYQDYKLHVIGSDVVDPDKLQRAVANADNVSNAVRAVTSAYFAAGYPAAQVVYALADKDLYILVMLGQVTTTAGPKYLTDYFEGMDASGPLTDNMLEPRRTLASLHADRAGANATPMFLPQTNGTYQIDLKPDKDAPKQTFLRVEVSNPGNRFVGRHFGDVDFKQTSKYGDEFHLAARRSLDFLNKNSENTDYTEYGAGWNRVTTWGVFGGSFSNQRYHLVLTDVEAGGVAHRDLPVQGDFATGELDWFGLLTASFDSRWTMQVRLGRTDKTLDGEAFDEGNLQLELYNWVEVSTLFSQVYHPGAQTLTIEGGVGLSKGLTTDDAKPGADPFSGAPGVDLAYLLWKPSMRVQLVTSSALTFTFEANGQVSDDNVPEQQQWVLGGLNNGSAWLPGLAVGDSGLIARFSIEPDVFQLSENLRLLPKVFAEYGLAQFENISDDSAIGRQRPGFADAGVTLTLGAYEWLEVELTWAEGFYDRDIEESELEASRANLFFKVAGKF